MVIIENGFDKEVVVDFCMCIVVLEFTYFLFQLRCQQLMILHYLLKYIIQKLLLKLMTNLRITNIIFNNSTAGRSTIYFLVHLLTISQITTQYRIRHYHTLFRIGSLHRILNVVKIRMTNIILIPSSLLVFFRCCILNIL